MLDWVAAFLVAALAFGGSTAQADSYTAAAVQVLRELSELHVRQFQIGCVPHAALQKVAPPPVPSEVTIGLARLHGKALYLDRELVCAPLRVYYLHQGPVHFSDQLLLGLDAVAVTYGFTLGLSRYYVAECYGVRVVWKWVLRFDPGYQTAVIARRYLLDNSYRPPGYKLKPSCTLSQPGYIDGRGPIAGGCLLLFPLIGRATVVEFPLTVGMQ